MFFIRIIYEFNNCKQMYQLTVNKTNSQFNITDLCFIVYMTYFNAFFYCVETEKVD